MNLPFHRHQHQRLHHATDAMTELTWEFVFYRTDSGVESTGLIVWIFCPGVRKQAVGWVWLNRGGIHQMIIRQPSHGKVKTDVVLGLKKPILGQG